MKFTFREEFRNWLSDHCLSSDGVWLLFEKAGGPGTLTAGEALEEALCFGWIDGQMQRIDARTYRKYFCQRREKSVWSDKNKALADQLEQRGLMTEHGRNKIAQAKQNGQWNAPKAPPVTQEQILALSAVLRAFEPAHTNFLAMPASVQKTYTRAYLDAKTDAGRQKRIAWKVARLNQNLKPM